VIPEILAGLADGAVLAPLAGLLVGVLLSLSPVSLPGVAASVATFSPGRLLRTGERTHLPLARAFPTVLAFVVGMDGVLAVAGYLFVELTVAFTRASVALHLLAAGLLGTLGLRLLLRRASLCARARSIPPRPHQAFVFGLVFAFTGCPGCGPIVVGLGSAAALTAGPGTALLAIGAFVLGRAATLVAAAGVGSRLLPVGVSDIRWARLDLVAGVLFLVAAGFYLFRVVNGDVTTILPGEPGGTLPG
jgi:cytochrome c biogenesis protein CcdA